jgi:amino acid adenylation domain-containing protein
MLHGAEGKNNSMTDPLTYPGNSEVERIMSMQMKTLSDSMSQLMNQQLETLKHMAVPGAINREKPVEDREKEERKSRDGEGLQGRSINFRSMNRKPDALTPKQREFVRRLIARYTRRTRNSKQYTARYRGVFSDWIHSLNFRPTLKELIYPVVSARSRGSRFHDIDGNEYIDIAMGYGASFFGHRPAFVIEALKEQIDKGFELGPQSAVAGEVASLIKELTGVERVTFCNTGSEAVMASLRLARTVTRRKKIIRFAGSYHGTSDGVLAASDENGTFPIAPGITAGMVEDVILLPYGSPESIQHIKQMGNQPAGVLVEPVQSRRPGFQPGEFLKELRKITLETGTALIFDEMITGFRIHPGGAQAHFGIQADIVTYGKILGGGLPMAVVAGKGEYLDAIDGGLWNYGDQSGPQKETTFFAGTYCKHPLSIAASRAVMRHMKETGPALQKQVNERTEKFVKKVNEFFTDQLVPIRVNHFGSLFRFESFGKYDLALLPVEMDLFSYLLLEQGVYSWESRICSLSTAHTDEDMEFIINAVKKSITELRAGGFAFEDKLSAGPRGKVSHPGDNRCFPMSSIQKSMFALSQLEGGEAAYHHTMAAIIEGEPDIQRLESALHRLLERHDSLRTGFKLENGEYIQEVREYLEITPAITRKKGTIDNIETLVWDFIQPFDLSRPPLIRMETVEFSQHSYLLMLDLHHIIADGISLNILCRELMDLYQRKSPAPINPRYKDYVKRERLYLDSVEFKSHEAFWLEVLPGELPRLSLPADFPRPPRQSFAGSTIHRELAKDLAKGLKKLARERGVTLYMGLLAVFNILLYKLTGQEDIIIGTPTSLREGDDFEHTIGMFTNTIVLRNEPAGNKSFAVFLEEVKANCSRAYAARRYPFGRLIQALNVKRDISHNPFFDVQFVYENAGERVFKIENLDFRPYAFEVKHAPLDFTFEVLEEQGRLNINLNYCPGLFKKESIQQWYRYFEVITAAIVKNTNTRLADIELLSKGEKQQILMEFNDTYMDYPMDKTLDQLFADQVEKAPDHIALVEIGDREIPGKHETGRQLRPCPPVPMSVTYRELDETSGQMARILTGKGVGADVIIGIMVERSAAMIVGLLGILKAGGAYLPIDPAYPKERINYILSDSSARLMVTTPANPHRFAAALPGGGAKKLETWFLDPPLPGEGRPIETGNFQPVINPAHLAYVIYTSGSTGRPRGVMIRHGSVAARFKNTNFIRPEQGGRLLVTGSIIFDITTFEIWWPLLNRISLVLTDQEQVMDTRKLKDIMVKQHITILHLIPQLFNQLARHDDKIFTGLHYFLVGGDLVRPAYINRLRKKYPGLKILHMYGPTENTTFSTYLSVNREYPVSLPIGKPANNCCVYILDKHRQCQPIGVAGELCTGGPGAARGYLNNPELTCEKFKNHKSPIQAARIPRSKVPLIKSFCRGPGGGIFQKEPPGRRRQKIYQTGDLARWWADGNIEFLGRIDFQVKIRGYRIELEEIEQALASQEKIKEAAIVTKKDKTNNPYLIAYYVVKENPETPDHEPGAAELRRSLEKRLPPYMVPSFFIPLDRLPLTPGGKIDRKALPGPGDYIPVEKGVKYCPPATEIEKKLVNIWKEVLELKPIGINDNFFERGGHSLNGLQVISRVQHELGVDIPFRQLFNYPTIAGLSGYIDSCRGYAHQHIPFIPEREYYEVSHSQKRMWVMSQLEGGGLAYNMVGKFSIRGKLDRGIFEQALRAVVRRHESLRTGFISINGEVKQRVWGEEAVNARVIYKDMRKTADREAVVNKRIYQEELISFNLKQPPLLRLQLFHLENRHYILLCNMHHIISDGWSIRVFIEELSALYNAFAGGKAHPLPLPRVQYKEYAAWQNLRLNSGRLRHSREYWLEKFAGEIPKLNLPLDYPRPDIQSFKGDTVNFIISKDLTAVLREFSRLKEVTLFMTLFAALNVLLFRLAFQVDIVMGTPAAGRTHKDTANVIGHFLNMLALRLTFDKEDSFSRLLKTAKTGVLSAFENQDYPLDTLVEQLNLKRDYSRGALFDVILVFNNKMDGNNVKHAFKFEEAVVEPYEVPGKTSITDIEFHFNEGETTIPFYIRYNTDLFKHETIKDIGRQWLELLECLSANRDKPIGDLQLLHEGEAQLEQVEAKQSKMVPISTDF